MNPRPAPGWSPYDLDAIPVPQEDTRPFGTRLWDFLSQGGPWGTAQPGQRGTFVPSKRDEPRDVPEVPARALGAFGGLLNYGAKNIDFPTIVSQPAESLHSLMTAPLSDLARMQDPDVTRTLAEQSFDVAGMLPAAGVAAGRTMPNNAAGIFGGRLAKTADQTALAKAEELAAKGAPREQIWQDTGWFKGVDGKWRFEIDDSEAYPVRAENPRTLGQALHHPDLYFAYPDMRNLKFVDDWGGAYESGGIFKRPKITASSVDTSTQLHEGQHRIQDVERFADGTSPEFEAFRSVYGDGLMAKSKLLVDLIRNRGGVIVGDEAAQDAMRSYMRNAGEVESRLVEKRMGLSAADRRARPPWLDYDVPENQQIVRLASNPDDPTTAAILALLTQQQGETAASSLGKMATSSRGSAMSVKDDIAAAVRAALDKNDGYSYGLRVTEEPLEAGKTAPPSKQWYQDFSEDVPGQGWDRYPDHNTDLPGPSTIGVQSIDDLETALSMAGFDPVNLKHGYYYGDHVSLIRSPDRISGRDHLEWILPNGEVVATWNKRDDRGK